MIHVRRGLGLAVPVFPAAQMGMTPAARIQIYGPYHGPDSPPETTPTRHHRSSPRRIHFSATQVLVGHANRVQPYPQTATGYPKTSISMLPPLFLSVRRGGPSPPRASVIDGQDLATAHHRRAEPESVLFSAIDASWAPVSSICLLTCQPVSAA